MFINLLYLNYEFLFYLSIFYSIYILYKKGKDLKLIIKSPIKLNNEGNWFKNFWFFFAFLLFTICFYYISKKILGISNISNYEYRVIKLTLGFSISILILSITIKEKGFKSWRTLFSFLSLCFLIFYISLLFDDAWRVLVYEKLNSYIVVCSIWICIFFSLFSHEYLYVSDINNINNLKSKLFKWPKSELADKPDMMKIEDLLNKEDSIQSKDNITSNKIQSNRIRIEDLLNRENSNNKLSETNTKNDINVRPITPDNIDSVSVMSHDSTISNAHISIIQGTKQLVKAAELFTNQWKEGKILGEDAKDKKEMLDEIIDLPDEKVFKLMNHRLNWEHDKAFSKFFRKRNMPTVPDDQLIEMANTAFNETMSNKDEKQKFWTRLKAYVKEPIKDKRNGFDALRKETLNLYIKGEEEPILTGEKKKNSLEMGSRKFKKGGLITNYEDKKIEAEATLQQQEIRAMKRGIEIKQRIMPSMGRLSIFEIMNQSVVSVINDFKKLSLDSSSSGNNNNEIKTDLTKSESNLKDDAKINIKNSPILDDNIDKSKSILIKGDNNELNKKRRIN